MRTTVLANSRQTLAVLGYIGAQASTFERLSLAGRMLKEVASRSPKSIGLTALWMTNRTLLRNGMDALLAAGLACAFQMPAYRAPVHDEQAMR